jgi:hypothetical protein
MENFRTKCLTIRAWKAEAFLVLFLPTDPRENYCAVPKINLKKWVRGVDLCRLIENRYLILL